MFNLLLTLTVVLAIVAPDTIQSTVSDGPYIFQQEDESYMYVSVVDGIVKTSILPKVEEITTFATTIPSVQTITLSTEFNYIPDDTLPMPPSLLALSDIEGNLEHLLQFLQIHKVIDKNYNWNWKSNHLLFNGDSVDRGEQVTELLWFIRKLQQQAKVAGGQVHFVLGNHDVMIMADDIRYTHNKYKSVSDLIDIPYHEMFGSNSVLGMWLRKQNSIVQIGPYMFIHAGYSPELLALNCTITEINNLIRKSIGPPAWPNRDNLVSSLAWHSKGPLWYRGYFEKHSEKYGPQPTSNQLQEILDSHNAQVIIVGHTVTGDIGYLDGNKKLIGIDVHWDTQGEGQGLLITNNILKRLTMDGTTTELLHIQTKK